MIGAIYTGFDNSLVKTHGCMEFFRGLLYGLSLDSARKITDSRYERFAAILDSLSPEDGSADSADMLCATYSQGIRGRALQDIMGYVERSVRKIRRTDDETLVTIRDLHARGARTGIITRNYGNGVERVLEMLKYGDVFDEVIGNRFVPRIGGPTLRWDVSDKADILISRLDEISISPLNAAYIGDDPSDKGALDIVRKPVISRFASDDFKHSWRGRALVLGDPGSDLVKYLED